MYVSVVCEADVPLRIVNLKPSTKYLLRVRAINDVGAGTPVIRNEFTENIRMYSLALWLGLTDQPHSFQLDFNFVCVGYDVVTNQWFLFMTIKTEASADIGNWRSWHLRLNRSRSGFWIAPVYRVFGLVLVHVWHSTGRCTAFLHNM